MRAPLRFEPLESRDVPATFGTPWPDGQHLTLSFVPDGTSILGAASNLDALPEARLAVLRAFQTWAVHADVNIGLVSDSGAAFGTGAGGQRDPRFGDIRIGGRALAPDVLAITAPYGRFDPYSGEIVLNTAANFGAGGYDPFTAALQEAGHALGVGNSPDVSSAMYEYYRAPRAGLSAADADAIRTLYGARGADAFEGATGNDTIATAAALAGPITADLTTATDADVFAFAAEPRAGRVTVRLRAAGLSLVTARVEVLDPDGRVLASGVASDPTRNDVTVSFEPARAGGTYFVRVFAARTDEFAVGSYELEVIRSSAVDPGGSDALITAHTRVRAAGAAEEVVALVPELMAGGLDAGGTASESFGLAQSGQVRLVLSATGAAEAVVKDAAGRAVGRFVVDAGRGRALDLFLSAGGYAVTVRAIGGSPLNFRLGLAVVTDPIGVRPEDPTSAPASTAPAGSNQPVTQLPGAPPVPRLGVAVPPVPPSTPIVGAPLRMPSGAPATATLFVPPPIMSLPAPLESIEYVWWY